MNTFAYIRIHIYSYVWTHFSRYNAHMIHDSSDSVCECAVPRLRCTRHLGRRLTWRVENGACVHTTRAHIFVCIHMYVFICMNSCMHSYVCIHMYVFICMYSYVCIHMYVFICMNVACVRTTRAHQPCSILALTQSVSMLDTLAKPIDKWAMGWLRLVGYLKLYVSFAEYRLFYRSLLRKKPVIQAAY